MRLKKDFDLIGFMRAVKQCRGEVIFHTKEDDRLNLKSTLAGFVFASLVESPDILYSAEVICEEPGDYERLRKYLVSRREEFDVEGEQTDDKPDKTADGMV